MQHKWKLPKRVLNLDNSCLPYVSNGFIPFLPRGTKSSTNAIPKRSKALALANCLNGAAFWNCNYRDNEDLPNGGFVFVRHVPSENTKTRLGNFHLCCISNVSTRQFYGRNVNTLEMQHKWKLSKRVNIAMARRFLTNRTCPVRVADDLGTTPGPPRDHPGTTSGPPRREPEKVMM